MSQTPSIALPDEAETIARAASFSLALRSGDTVLLEGPIGAGKSAFARAVIRALCGAHIDVPSPTFTLVQTYESPQGAIWHSDLYRLSDPQEIVELGLEEAFQTAICLIEWPDRLGDLRPKGALHLRLAADPDQPGLHHLHLVSVPPNWAGRLGALNA